MLVPCSWQAPQLHAVIQRLTETGRHLWASHCRVPAPPVWTKEEKVVFTAGVLWRLGEGQWSYGAPDVTRLAESLRMNVSRGPRSAAGSRLILS